MKKYALLILAIIWLNLNYVETIEYSFNDIEINTNQKVCFDTNPIYKNKIKNCYIITSYDTLEKCKEDYLKQIEKLGYTKELLKLKMNGVLKITNK